MNYESPPGKEIEGSNPFESVELLLSLFFLGFGLLVVAFEVYLVRKDKITLDYAYKCIVITVIIICSSILVTAGYSNNQISGVLGILGSIAGYVMSKGSSKDS